MNSHCVVVITSPVQLFEPRIAVGTCFCLHEPPHLLTKSLSVYLFKTLYCIVICLKRNRAPSTLRRSVSLHSSSLPSGRTHRRRRRLTSIFLFGSCCALPSTGKEMRPSSEIHNGRCLSFGGRNRNCPCSQIYTALADVAQEMEGNEATAESMA